MLEYTPPAHKGLKAKVFALSGSISFIHPALAGCIEWEMLPGSAEGGYNITMEETIQKLLPGVLRQESLARHTTFRIGGRARYFFTAASSEKIATALLAAKKARIPVFILSGGSNVLFSDKGFEGLVVHITSSGVSFKETRIVADAGVSMASLVKIAAEHSLAGLEWAGGLPGTLGGAIRGNAGAFGGEIKDTVVSVKAIDGKSSVRVFSKKQCKFSYRSSIFKEKRYVVLSAVLGLKKGNAKELFCIARSHMRYRKERHPLEYPNAGSVFKNCDAAKLSARWKKYFADKIKQDPFPVVPTAALIAEAKLKGLRIGKVEVSKKHPNYIVNLGGGSAKDVIAVIARVKKLVHKKFDVRLEEEIQFVTRRPHP